MSKGSRRRREDTAAVEANWPFPDRRKERQAYQPPPIQDDQQESDDGVQ